MTQSDTAQRAKRIRLLVLDVDGVLTDGKLYFGADGTESKAFHTLDGHGIKLLQRSGVKVAIITGRTSKAVEIRAQGLGVSLLRQGREDKWHALQEILTEYPADPADIACMGDDYPDLTIMRHVGLALTVPGAHPVVKQHAHWQSECSAGAGAVREACDMIMQAQGTFESALANYLKQHE